MDQILIYVSYVQYEYRNYFHLVINTEVVAEYHTEEEVDKLFQSIMDKSNGRNFELYIVQDRDALAWDYRQAFQEHDMDLRESGDIDPEQLCGVMGQAFESEFEVNATDTDLNKKIISVLFFGECVLQSDNNEPAETPGPPQVILEPGGNKEKTELTQIIEEKHERMNSHG